jgi:hypothetical protein
MNRELEPTIEHADQAQRLTEHYGRMVDAELLNLAADPDQLTEIARQVLRAEMNRRGLDEPETPRAQRASPADSNRSIRRRLNASIDPILDSQLELDSETDSESESPADGEPVEFTWKTELCSCNDWKQGQLLRETLYRAGIESWTEPPYAQHYGIDFRILVAADQLDAALRIAEKPIPQDIVDESKIEIPAFQPPTCPHCGASEPVLVSVEPANSWLCEVCGMDWSEPAGAPIDPADN